MYFILELVLFSPKLHRYNYSFFLSNFSIILAVVTKLIDDQSLGFEKF